MAIAARELASASPGWAPLPSKKGAPKKSAGDSSKAPTPTKDTDHSSDALTADEESTKQKPAKKPKLTQEAKEKKAKKAKPAAEEGAEPKENCLVNYLFVVE